MTDPIDVAEAILAGIVVGAAFWLYWEITHPRPEVVDFDEVRRTVKAPLHTGGVIQHRPPTSYIIPVTCGHYTRCAWYVCGTTEQIIEHLWLKREPISYHFEEDDGA